MSKYFFEKSLFVCVIQAVLVWLLSLARSCSLTLICHNTHDHTDTPEGLFFQHFRGWLSIFVLLSWLNLKWRTMEEKLCARLRGKYWLKLRYLRAAIDDMYVSWTSEKDLAPPPHQTLQVITKYIIKTVITYNDRNYNISSIK